jgi:hypothetical protein
MVSGIFSIDDRYFHNLPIDAQERMLKLMVYFCEGTAPEIRGYHLALIHETYYNEIVVVVGDSEIPQKRFFFQKFDV